MTPSYQRERMAQIENMRRQIGWSEDQLANARSTLSRYSQLQLDRTHRRTLAALKRNER